MVAVVQGVGHDHVYFKALTKIILLNMFILLVESTKSNKKYFYCDCLIITATADVKIVTKARYCTYL